VIEFIIINSTIGHDDANAASAEFDGNVKHQPKDGFCLHFVPHPKRNNRACKLCRYRYPNKAVMNIKNVHRYAPKNLVDWESRTKESGLIVTLQDGKTIEVSMR
jgi:hypothetical protein